MKHVKLEIGQDNIAVLTLDHATESVNLVSPDWLDEMNQAIETIAANEAVTGVIVTSAKSVFMAGADLKFMVDAYEKLTPHQAYEFAKKATGMHRRLETIGKPVVAAINGLALGGGFELCLACHGRVLVDNPKAQVGLPEVNVGLLPGSGGTQRLARIAGMKVAQDLLLSGRSVAPAEALKLKIVDQVVPAGQLLDAARAWLAANPDPVRAWDKKGFSLPESIGLLNAASALNFSTLTGSLRAKYGDNYPAPIAILSTLFEGVQLAFDKALDVEAKYFATLLSNPVARNIIRTTFLNKGLAEKLVSRPQGVDKFKVTKVAVLGAGMMGAGIAFVSAQAGINVTLLDSTIEQASKGKDYSVKILKKDVERGKRTQDQADAILARITPTADYNDLAGAELVVEAVFEDTGIKGDVTRKAEAVLGKDLIFATNTSTLPITQLAEASERPDQFIGLHFFSPVDRMALVEVILGKKTSQETLAKGLDFVAQLRKTPIIVNDSRGFYTSRVFQTLIHEGAAMLGEGVAPALIENAAKAAGMPVGPLALLDELTVDLPLKIVTQAIAEEGDRYTPPCGTAVMTRMQKELNRPSRKAGGGFYEYPQGGKKFLWPGLAQAFPQAAAQPSVDELKLRFLAHQAIETARCLEENVLTTAVDGDLGAVLGWGFPTWTGGTLSYIDTVGIKEFVAVCDRLAQQYGPRFAPSDWLRAKAEKGEGFYPSAKGNA